MNNKKPDLSTAAGILIDADFISPALRGELLLHLKTSPLSESQKHGLVEFASEMWQSMRGDDLQPGKLQRQQIEEIATNARRLLASLRKIERPALDALHSITAHAVHSSAPPVALSSNVVAAIRQPHGNLAAEAWDWIDALEKVATYTGERFQIDKTSKPALQQARGYVAIIAQHLLNVTGGLPPTDRAAWFAAFMGCLGEKFGLPIGPRIIASGIKAAR